MAIKKSTSKTKKSVVNKSSAKKPVAGAAKSTTKRTKAIATKSETPTPAPIATPRRLPSIRLPALEMPDPVSLPVRKPSERITRSGPQEPVSVRPTVVQVPTKSNAELHIKIEALEKTVVRLTKQNEELRGESERHQAVIKQLRLELRVMTNLKKAPTRK